MARSMEGPRGPLWGEDSPVAGARETEAPHDAMNDARVAPLLVSPTLILAQAMSGGTSPDSRAGQSPVSPAVANASQPARWQPAPIRFWGDFSYDFRRTTIDGQPAFTRNSAIANLNASTYLYEPWVAIVTAGLGLTFGKLNDGQLAGNDRFATGYARLNVFPSSRFPFEARYSRSDRGIDSESGGDQSYRLTRYGLSQRYRDDDGGAQYSASFDRFTQDGTAVGKDIQSALQLDANAKFRRDHDFQLLGSWNRNQRVNTGDRSDYETLVGRHSFRPGAAISLENSVNLTRTNSRFAFAESDLRILQLNSIVFWRPEGRPIAINGSFRLFSLETGTGQNTTETSAANISGGATYAISRNLRALGGISITDSNAGGQHHRPLNGTIGVTYQGDAIEMRRFHYDWFTGGTGIFASGAPDRNGFSFNGMFGQSLSRAFSFGNGGALTINASQNVAAITGTPVEGSKQLFHSGSITWNKTGSESPSTLLIRLSATDSRYLDGQRETFRLLNLQLTRTLEFGRNRSFSGNLTIQTTRRISQRPGFGRSLNEGKPETTASADVDYRHQNLFGVPRLVFLSRVQLNRQELVQALGLPGDRELRSWENRLDYSLGRLETRLLIRVADVDRTRNWLAMLRFMRRF